MGLRRPVSSRTTDAFLKATAPGRSALLRYEQWNIDPASVVSFAALAFGRGEASPPREGGA